MFPFPAGIRQNSSNICFEFTFVKFSREFNLLEQKVQCYIVRETELFHCSGILVLLHASSLSPETQIDL